MILHNSSISCQFWPDKPYKCDIAAAVQKICPSLSIVGCLFIIIVIWLFKKYHVFVQRLIAALAISAMFQSSSYLIGNIYSHGSSQAICFTQAFMMQYFMWSTLSWVIVITINMVFIVKGIDSKRFEYRYHLFAWLNALVWAALPFIGNNYGHAGIWCWIKKDNPWLRFGVWYIPLFVICVSLLIVYVYIFKHSKKLVKTNSTRYNKVKERANKRYRREVKPLLVYPLIYVVLTIPIFIYRLYDATHPDQPPNFALLLVSVLFSPSVGFCNALAYAFYNKTIEALKWKNVKIAFYTRIFGKEYHVRAYSVDDRKPDKLSEKDFVRVSKPSPPPRQFSTESSPDKISSSSATSRHMLEPSKLNLDELTFHNSMYEVI